MCAFPRGGTHVTVGQRRRYDHGDARLDELREHEACELFRKRENDRGQRIHRRRDARHGSGHDDDGLIGLCVDPYAITGELRVEQRGVGAHDMPRHIVVIGVVIAAEPDVVELQDFLLLLHRLEAHRAEKRLVAVPERLVHGNDAAHAFGHIVERNGLVAADVDIWQRLVEFLQIGEVFPRRKPARSIVVAHEHFPAVRMDEYALPTDQDIVVMVGGFELELGRCKLDASFDLEGVEENGMPVNFETVVLEDLDGLIGLEDNAFLGKDLARLLVDGLHLLGREHVELSSYVHRAIPASSIDQSSVRYSVYCIKNGAHRAPSKQDYASSQALASFSVIGRMSSPELYGLSTPPRPQRKYRPPLVL